MLDGRHTDKESLLRRNRYYEARVSQKHREALRFAEQIYDYIDVNFDIQLPDRYKVYKETVERSYRALNGGMLFSLDEIDAAERWLYINEEYSHLIRLYYRLRSTGVAIANRRTVDGVTRTFTVAVMYSRHRLDPLWNWRKSLLIRNIYRTYIRSHKLWDYHPLHIVLTLPHAGGTYRGKRFYVRELIEHFNTLRKSLWWKRHVYGGEYGVEVKRSKHHGYHIHIHSFALLYSDVRVNEFRDELRRRWSRLIGHDESVCIWAETLYYYKRDDSGEYLRRNKYPHEYKPGEYEVVEAPDGMYDVVIRTPRTVRVKTYIDREIRDIQQMSHLSDDEKERLITDIFLKGVLECIKYHFKQDTFYYSDELRMYDIETVNDVLKHTYHVRLYNRYGGFYREEELSFNYLYGDDTDDGSSEVLQFSDDQSVSEIDDVPMGKALRWCDPFTGEPLSDSDADVVIYSPAARRYNGRYSIRPYEEVKPPPPEIFIPVPTTDIRQIIKEFILKQFI